MDYVVEFFFGEVGCVGVYCSGEGSADFLIYYAWFAWDEHVWNFV